MSASTYLLFADAREQEATLRALTDASHAVHEGMAGDVMVMPFRAIPALNGFPSAWRAVSSGLDPLVMIEAISHVEWLHPVKVLYRTSDEVSWSFVTVNWRGPEESWQSE